MKIDGNLPQTGLSPPRSERVEQSQVVEQRDAQGSAPLPKPPERNDKLNISSTAEKLNQTASQPENSPEFRADKVAALKTQIENGTYQVSGMDVAQKMVNTMRNGL
jgi:negative regulator of flagellin synthesis FlgM